MSKALGGELAKRISTLEGRVEALEAVVAEIRGPLVPAPVAAHGRTGRPQKTGDATLCGERDKLIDWLEAVWPDLEAKVLPAMNAAEIHQVLGPYEQYEQAKHLMRQAEALAAFLRSGRWFMPPKARLARAFGSWATPAAQAAAQKAAMSLPTRQIACAMAGLPSLSWRTSFARAQRMASPMAVRAQTEEFYRIKFKLPWPKETWARAKGGEPWAQYRVGLSYAHGIGVAKDYATAADWYERAAKLGEPEAQIALAELYQLGQGVQQDAGLAFLWAKVAPLTPDRERWRKKLMGSVPACDLERIQKTAERLNSLIHDLRFERSIHPPSPLTAKEQAILGNIDSLLGEAAAVPTGGGQE